MPNGIGAMPGHPGRRRLRAAGCAGAVTRSAWGAWYSARQVDDGEGKFRQAPVIFARQRANHAELDEGAAEPSGAGPAGEGLDGVAEVVGAGVKGPGGRRLAWWLVFLVSLVQLCLEARRAWAVGVGVTVPVVRRRWC